MGDDDVAPHDGGLPAVHCGEEIDPETAVRRLRALASSEVRHPQIHPRGHFRQNIGSPLPRHALPPGRWPPPCAQPTPACPQRRGARGPRSKRWGQPRGIPDAEDLRMSPPGALCSAERLHRRGAARRHERGVADEDHGVVRPGALAPRAASPRPKGTSVRTPAARRLLQAQARDPEQRDELSRPVPQPPVLRQRQLPARRRRPEKIARGRAGAGGPADRAFFPLPERRPPNLHARDGARKRDRRPSTGSRPSRPSSSRARSRRRGRSGRRTS